MTGPAPSRSEETGGSADVIEMPCPPPHDHMIGAWIADDPEWPPFITWEPFPSEQRWRRVDGPGTGCSEDWAAIVEATIRFGWVVRHWPVPKRAPL